MAAALFPIHQFFDNNGDPLAGGLVYTYEPGSTTPKTAYTDAALSVAHANPVVLDAYGRPTSPIWCDGETKIVVKTSGDVQINPVFDNFNKDVSGSGPWASKEDDVISKSANYDLTTADDGKMVRATSSTWTLGTASAAATMGNGYLVTVVNDGTGVVTFNPNGSETVNGLTSIPIGPGDYVLLRCDGSNWFAAWARDDAPRGAFKNRAINGDVRIDQRSGGSAVTVNSTSTTYGPDGWRAVGQSADGVFTIARSTSTPPAGFSHFLRITTTTADASIGAGQRYAVSTPFEGLDMIDLGFGAAGARPVAISFWARSSLTGTFCAALRNNGGARTYPFTFTIDAADTWEYKTVTIEGDASGTWATDNTVWGSVMFNVGAGSDFHAAAGAWTGGDNNAVSGSVSLIGTLNATLDITGFQLEAGAVATEFERLSYSDLETRCARYFQRYVNGETADRMPAPYLEMYGYMVAGATFQFTFPLPYPMRTTPTATRVGTWSVSGVTGQPTLTPSNRSSVTLTCTKDGSSGAAQVSPAVAAGYTLSAEL